VGAIVGAYPRNSEAVKFMAEQLPHRGQPVLPVSAANDCNVLHHPDVKSPMRLAQLDGLTVALDGRIVNAGELASRLGVSVDLPAAMLLARLFSAEGIEALDSVKGGYAVAFHTADGAQVARDVLGLQPLYYGFSGEEFLYASEAKSLVPWVQEVIPVPPGCVVDHRGNVTRFDQVVRPTAVPASPEEAAEKLRELTELAVDRRLAGASEAHAFLSGGLDSSIIAALLSQRVDKLYTYTVGTPEAGDVKHSRIMVDFLKSDHREYLFSGDDLVEILPNVIYSFESFTQDFMQAGLGTYLVSRLVANQGVHFIFCGEGPDEVFGGYDDIKATIDDPELFQKVSIRITEELYMGGGTRLERMTAAQGLEYAVPFLDRDVVRFGLNLPPEWRVNGEERMEKWIVRKAFEDLLPEEIAWRRKSPFARGAGALDTAKLVADKLGVPDPSLEKSNDPKRPLTKLDQLYYDIFKRFYRPEKMERLFARWDPFRERFGQELGA